MISLLPQVFHPSATLPPLRLRELLRLNDPGGSSISSSRERSLITKADLRRSYGIVACAGLDYADVDG